MKPAPTTTAIRSFVVAAIAALALTACGAPDDEPAGLPAADEPVAGACHEDTPDCVDTAVPEDGGDPAGVDEAALIARAEQLLGTPESDLPDEVRVARRGPESFALTEDYVVGRFTVELDEGPDGDDVFRVTEARVELTEQVHVAAADSEGGHSS